MDYGPNWALRAREYCAEMGKFFSCRSTLDPQSVSRIRWNYFIMMLSAYTCIVLPWQMSFEPHLREVLFGLDIVVSIMMLVDVFCCFRTGYIDYAGNVVFDSMLIRRRYIGSFFVLDLLSSLPFEIFWKAGVNKEVCDLLSVFQLLRVGRLMRPSGSKNQLLASPGMRIVKLTLVFVMLAHFFGSAFFYLGMHQGEGDAVSWVERAGLTDSRPWKQYVASLYWALTTMVTVGYGDISATTATERLMVIPVLVCSGLVYATVFGNVAYAIESIQSTFRRYQSKQDMVKEFVKVYEVPRELQRKLYEYNEVIWNQTKGFDTSAFLSQLPISVRADIMTYLHQNLIDNVPFFKQCSDRCLEAIILSLHDHVCLAGDFVFKQGDNSRELYFIRTGNVRVSMEDEDTGAETVVGTIASYSVAPFFGEIALLLGEARTASVQATTKTVCSYLTQIAFENIKRGFPEEFLDSMRDTAAKRLRRDVIRQEQQDIIKRQRRNGSNDQSGSPPSPPVAPISLASHSPMQKRVAALGSGASSRNASGRLQKLESVGTLHVDEDKVNRLSVDSSFLINSARQQLSPLAEEKTSARPRHNRMHDMFEEEEEGARHPLVAPLPQFSSNTVVPLQELHSKESASRPVTGRRRASLPGLADSEGSPMPGVTHLEKTKRQSNPAKLLQSLQEKQLYAVDLDARPGSSVLPTDSSEAAARASVALHSLETRLQALERGQATILAKIDQLLNARAEHRGLPGLVP